MSQENLLILKKSLMHIVMDLNLYLSVASYKLAVRFTNKRI